jgi:hypothetical protein
MTKDNNPLIAKTMILEQTEQQSIIDLMDNYRKLHEEITKIEVMTKDFEQSLRQLHKDKDAVIKGIEDNRENESGILKGLVEKYGEGKLDLSKFEWITNK